MENSESFGLPSENFQSRTNVLKKMTKYALMIKQMQVHFKESFCNLANNSVAKLPPPSPF